MSYCRYSPDCDLYLCSSVYGGFNGSYRTPGSHGTIAGSTVREHFSCVTRVEALEIVEGLKSKGVLVPDAVVDTLREEIRSGMPDPEWDGTFV